MSVVVAIKKDNKVYLGADSQVTRGGTRKTMSNPNNYKIWNVKGTEHCMMAHVGTVRDANVIRVANMIPEIVSIKGNVDFDFMVKTFVPKLFDTLKESSLLLKDSDGVPFSRSEFLLAYKDRLFQIAGDGVVIEIDDYCAIGSGASEAIGSLLSTENMDTVERIKNAIRASAANDIYVDYPIVVANTDETTMSVFKEEDFRKKA